MNDEHLNLDSFQLVSDAEIAQFLTEEDDEGSASAPYVIRENDCSNDEMIALSLSQESSVQKRDSKKKIHLPSQWVPSFLKKGKQESTRKQYKRLQKRIKAYGMVELRMPNDGNCQFSSIADQIYGSWEAHSTVRRTIIEHITRYPDYYRRFLPYNFDAYLAYMSQLGMWGDNVTLQAASNLWGVNINLITSSKENTVLELVPNADLTEADPTVETKTIWLSFLGELHYNSLFTPEVFAEKKKNILMARKAMR